MQVPVQVPVEEPEQVPVRRQGRQLVVAEVHRGQNQEDLDDQTKQEQHEQPEPEHEEIQVERPARSDVYENPLVKFGVVSPEVAEVFYPAEEVIPAGRKVAVRGRSKARILTSAEAKEHYIEELRRVKEAQEKKEERKRKRA